MIWCERGGKEGDKKNCENISSAFDRHLDVKIIILNIQ
jgi:hypothetical protein